MINNVNPPTKLSQIIFALVVILLVLAPLFRGGNRPIALMLIELLGLALLLLMISQPQRILVIPRYLRYFIVIFVSIPLLYLIPIPIDWWAVLPGREGYYEVLSLLEHQDVLFHSFSINSLATELSNLVIIPIAAIFMSCFFLNQKQLFDVIKFLILLGALQAIIGLMQFSTSIDHWIRFGIETHSTNAVGTYPNRNHFSGLLEMILPLAIAYWAICFNHRISKDSRHHWRTKLAYLADKESLLIAGVGVVILLLILGVVFSRSRTGIALVMLCIFLSAILLTPKLNRKRGIRGIVFLVTLVLVIAAQIGLAPVFQRFADQDPLTDSRWTIYRVTSDAISQYFPLGSGPGTYESVLLGFQPNNIQHFINHAHNDYLEWMTELGIFSVILFIGFLSIISWKFIQLMRNKDWGDINYIQMGCGIGIFLMLLHSLTDYNLRIPANALIFAFLCGVFLKSNHEPTKKRVIRNRKAKTYCENNREAKRSLNSPRNQRNPFLN